MQNENTNNNTLLLCPKVFGYEHVIKSSLLKLGHEVIYFNERPNNSFVVKALLRLNITFALSFFIKRYFNHILKTAIEKNVSTLLIVNAEATPEWFLVAIKKHLPKIEIVLYMWDSFSNKPKAKNLIRLCDKVWTFDPKDAELNDDVFHKALFYSKKATTFEKRRFDYDISFIGTLHSQRYSEICGLRSIAQNAGLKFYTYFYCPSKLLFYVKKYITREFRYIPRKEVNFDSLSLDDVHNIISSSKAVVDIQHSRQSGLTMRTIEVLGNQTKLITTNQSISKYAFYNDVNILVLDLNSRYDNQLIIDFIDANANEINKEIEPYYIDNWLESLVGKCEK